MDFAQHCRIQSEGCDEYLSRIGFSVECTFSLDGIVNRHDVRIWGTEHINEVNRVPRQGNIGDFLVCSFKI